MAKYSELDITWSEGEKNYKEIGPVENLICRFVPSTSRVRIFNHPLVNCSRKPLVQPFRTAFQTSFTDNYPTYRKKCANHFPADEHILAILCGHYTEAIRFSRLVGFSEQLCKLDV